VNLLDSVRRFARRHADASELGLGLLVAVGVLVVSLGQWGLSDTGLARGFLLGVPLAVLTTATYRRRRRREEERERRLLEQRVELARDLHDAVAGQVAAIGVQAAAARLVLTRQPQEAAQALERIEVASRAAVADLRRMLIALREGDGHPPSAVRQPGLDQVDELLDGARRGGLDASLTVTGTRPSKLDGGVDRAAYRILQEALANAVRHGSGGTASVDIEYRPDSIRLRARNPAPGGTGSSSPARAGGLGLIGMRERAARVGGEVTAGPTADGQWTVEARLPVHGDGDP
jgi:signal transduction histidine kinase